METLFFLPEGFLSCWTRWLAAAGGRGGGRVFESEPRNGYLPHSWYRQDYGVVLVARLFLSKNVLCNIDTVGGDTPPPNIKSKFNYFGHFLRVATTDEAMRTRTHAPKCVVHSVSSRAQIPRCFSVAFFLSSQFVEKVSLQVSSYLKKVERAKKERAVSRKLSPPRESRLCLIRIYIR